MANNQAARFVCAGSEFSFPYAALCRGSCGSRAVINLVGGSDGAASRWKVTVCTSLHVSGFDNLITLAILDPH